MLHSSLIPPFCDFPPSGQWMGCTESVSLLSRTSPAVLSSPTTTTSIRSTRKSRWSIISHLLVEKYSEYFMFRTRLWPFCLNNNNHLFIVLLPYSKFVSVAQRAAGASSEGRASVLTACPERQVGLGDWVDSRRSGSPNTSSKNEWVTNVHRNTEKLALVWIQLRFRLNENYCQLLSASVISWLIKDLSDSGTV